MIDITRHWELNMLSPDIDPGAVSTMAIKNRCPAIVMSPEFVPAMLVDKSAKNGQYKIIAAIDFPEGKSFALEKLTKLDVMSMEVDGMDIMLSYGKSEIETRNEIKTLVEFIRGSINPVMEIRYVLRAHSSPWQLTETCLKAMKEFQPTMLRVDPHLEIPKVGVKNQVQIVAKIRELCPKPIKISGNVDLTTIKHFEKINAKAMPRFDVDPKQAIHIINELKNV